MAMSVYQRVMSAGSNRVPLIKHPLRNRALVWNLQVVGAIYGVFSIRVMGVTYLVFTLYEYLVGVQRKRWACSRNNFVQSVNGCCSKSTVNRWDFGDLQL